MRKKILVSFLWLTLLGLPLATWAQEKYTLSGYIKDELSGETLIGATIQTSPGNKAVLTNAYGYFSITLAKGTYKISISFAGYYTALQTVVMDSSQVHTWNLSAKNMLEEVVVSSKIRDANVKSAQMGKIDLSTTQLKSVPVIFGEVDVLKTLQLFPGIRNAGEGNTGLYVRGGGPDQNLILLDDAIVYNTGHLFGFFSIFNADAIKNTSIIKGGIPAQYGGRLSSVLDVAMKDGNNKNYEVDGGIGAIASRISIQGPIQKEKSSFMISARRTYVDMLAKPFIPKSSDFYGSGYYFYDLNTKVNFKVTEKDKIYLSGYFGRDVFNFNNKGRSFGAKIPWGNATATLRWNRLFHRKLFANTTLLYNDYYFTFAAKQNDLVLQLNSGIRDLTAKTDFDYYPAPQHKLKFGINYTYHRFTPNVLSGNQGETAFSPYNEGPKWALESGAYVQHDWDWSDDLKLSTGLRFSRFSQQGPFTVYNRDANGNQLDSIHYGRGQNIKTYQGLEPRFTVRYNLNEETSLKASVTRNMQYIHLVSNAGSTLPTDLWVPSTYRVKPQISWMGALGLFKNFKDNTYETSVELYYKNMQNQIEYKEGYTQSLKDPETDFVFGRGWSYGAEYFINKTKGKFTGWIGYTLSWTWRQFPNLNEGKKFPAKYDRRHDMSVVGMYTFNKKWKASAVFVYGTGNATSLPERFYVVSGVLTQEYSRINQYRLPAYHRLDLSATLTPKKAIRKKYSYYWVFSIYNAYSRMNPYFIYYDQTGSPFEGTLKVDARQVSLFPIIPSVTLNFKL